MHRTPAATPTARAVPVAADVALRQRRPDPAAVPDEERIRRQAARGVDDHRVGDEGERERAEVAGTEGARHEQSKREVAEARDALVGHTPAEASHGLDHAMLTRFRSDALLIPWRSRSCLHSEGRATVRSGDVS